MKSRVSMTFEHALLIRRIVVTSSLGLDSELGKFRVRVGAGVMVYAK